MMQNNEALENSSQSRRSRSRDHYARSTRRLNHLDSHRAKSAEWHPDTKRLSGFETKHGSPVMRGFVAAIVPALAAVAMIAPANALSGPMPESKLQNLVSTNVEQIVVVRRGGAVARGPRGGVAAVGRTTVVRLPGYRPGVRPGYGPRYVRPAYRWGPGGAIAAGAALGFVAAGTATAWAGAAPAPGYCWYYTDPSRTQGFWDVCP
jgi:hypothetical protein